MSTIAYCYYDPTWETRPDPTTWGWEFTALYEDTTPQRSHLQILLQTVKANPPTTLIVRRLEELGDSVATVTQVLTQLETLGIEIVALEQAYRSHPDEDSSTPTQSDLIALFHDIEQQQRSRHIRQGHAHNRLKRLPPPGKPPYGYRRGRDRYLIDRSVSPILRDFYDHFLIYGSIRGAVRHLAQKHGKKISVSTAQRWLTHPVYRGDLLYKKHDVQPNTHAPILLRTEAAQVDRLLRRNRSLAPRSASAPRSLAGLVTCQQCQSPFNISQVTPSRKGEAYLYLRPMNCPQQPKCRALRYEAVLDKTIDTICQTLPQEVAGLAQLPLDQIITGAKAAITAKQAIIAQLPDLVNQQILDTQTADLRAYTLNTEIAELQHKLAQLPPVNLIETTKTVSIQQFWLDLSESERRFYFREFIRKIEIVRDPPLWSVHLTFIF